MTATGTAHYSILAVNWPGAPAENAGVLLVDPETGQARVRLRRDWAKVVDEEDLDFFEPLQDDLNAKLKEMGAEELLHHLEESLSGVLRISDREAVAVDDFDQTLNRLYHRHVRTNVLEFRTHLPLYSLRAAAGRFGDDEEVTEEGWVEAPEDLRVTDDMFIVHITGDSMEPKIPEGSLCVFRTPKAGSRQGKIVLVRLGATSQTGGQVTVKRYRSKKVRTEEGWAHERITMEPLNQPKHQPWELEPGQTLDVIGEFVRVL